MEQKLLATPKQQKTKWKLELFDHGSLNVYKNRKDQRKRQLIGFFTRIETGNFTNEELEIGQGHSSLVVFIKDLHY